jgi:hypothetical protein
VRGNPASFTLTISSIGGWTAPVNVTCSSGIPGGAACSADGKSFTPGTQSVSIQSQSAAPGTYTVSIDATGNGILHHASATLIIQGISGTFSSSQATISVGSSSNFNVTLNSLGGTAGQFTFSCLNVPAGVSCAFNPPTGALSANGTLGTVLTVIVASRPSLAPPQSTAALRQFRLDFFVAALFLIFAMLMIPRSEFSVATRLRGRPLKLVFPVISLTLILCLTSCGGSSGTPPPPPPPQPVTFVIGVQAASTSNVTAQIGSITITVP